MKIHAELPGLYIGQVTENMALARTYPGGAISMAGGSPEDPVPAFIREALTELSDAHGYTPASGTVGFRTAARDWMIRRLGAPAELISADDVIPLVGTKELLTLLPTLLGIGEGDTIAVPDPSYPSFPVGAILSGATPYYLPAGELPQPGTKLIWVNSPSNPTGEIVGADYLTALITWARANDALIAADECYIEFHWDESDKCVSVLSEAVNGGSLDNILAIYSMSKRSNLAGYRVGFMTGDPSTLPNLKRLRDYLGLMVPTPILGAAAAALRDDDHVEAQRLIYADRAARMTAALEYAGFQVDLARAGLFLWATEGKSSYDSARWFAQRGIAVTEGASFGPAGEKYVRIALTSTRVDEAIARLVPASHEAQAQREPAGVQL
ncbi:succinyldiaminopimelate transaminase [Cryobacterium arcticum]|uniref:Aminotransferase n=1 Tax=Cryobacterium arcticum TaxID=670052 RepID=A0A318A2U6_9MICO|nr:succinyldiaminopimelate transaminase [Cryobacterium arcticum]PXA73234.1 succinyldiaminopimelate transaminase [Cryobacterium arcticum]